MLSDAFLASVVRAFTGFQPNDHRADTRTRDAACGPPQRRDAPRPDRRTSRERQPLRAEHAGGETLEANRVRIVEAQWELSARLDP